MPDRGIDIVVGQFAEAACLGGSARSENGAPGTHFPIDQSIHITLRYRVPKNLPYSFLPSFNFCNEAGQVFYVCTSTAIMPGIAGDYSATCVVPPYFLNNQRFT